jgi:hypothetical protein
MKPSNTVNEPTAEEWIEHLKKAARHEIDTWAIVNRKDRIRKEDAMASLKRIVKNGDVKSLKEWVRAHEKKWTGESHPWSTGKWAIDLKEVWLAILKNGPAEFVREAQEQSPLNAMTTVKRFWCLQACDRWEWLSDKECGAWFKKNGPTGFPWVAPQSLLNDVQLSLYVGSLTRNELIAASLLISMLTKRTNFFGFRQEDEIKIESITPLWNSNCFTQEEWTKSVTAISIFNESSKQESGLNLIDPTRLGELLSAIDCERLKADVGVQPSDERRKRVAL